MSITINGFLMGLSLIIAIGPQNALLLRQGMARVGVTAVVSICLVSDILLIFGGTAGVGVIVERAPIVLSALKWFGFFYLLYFAYTCFRDAWKPHGRPAEPAPKSEPTIAAPEPHAPASGGVAIAERTKAPAKTRPSWVQPALAALAMTWLNPAAYLDALVMLGNLANQHGETGRWYFATGALLASVVWFPTIGYGAAKLAGPLSNPRIAKMVNIGIGLVMVGIALRLILH